MDIVPHTTAIRRRIIKTKNFKQGVSAERGVYDPRNQVRFAAVSFAAFDAGAGGIKVAKGDVLEPGVGAVVGENLFEGKFGFAVGIDGGFAVIFWNGSDVRFAVR